MATQDLSGYEIVAGGDRLEAAKRLGRETISAEIITGEDASSSSTSEGPRRVNTTALLHAEGQTRHAAVRPQVRWRDASGTVRRKPALVDQGMVAERTIVLDQVSSNAHIRELSFGEFEIGVPPIPLESADVESLRESICLVGQTTPVLVREFSDGRLALLDGWGRFEALRAIGRATISAVILSGLSDPEARLKQIVSNHRKKLSALDRAREDYEFLRIVRERVSHGATPAGGRQPADKCHAKAADELNVSPDRIARSEQIVRILPEAQAKIRELKLHDNQSTLLKIAGAGDTANLQIAKAMELYARPKAKRAEEPIEMLPAGAVTTDAMAITSAAADGGGSEMPDIPPFLRRNRHEIGYERIKEEWARCDLRELLLAAEPAARRRFLDECLMPTLFPAVALTAVAEEVLA
jgi:ParB-like chromosome segregation protein Spo0J